MVNATFSGTVSAQAVAGETVTIIVTKPDKTTDTWTATTLADWSYSVTKPYIVAGNYSYTTSISADAGYTAASITGTFVVPLAARTITTTVTVQ